MGRAVHPHIITPDSAMLGESYGIDIPRSLRFNTNNGSNQYLTKNSGGGSATKWTYSLWSKNLKIGNGVFMGYNGNNSSLVLELGILNFGKTFFFFFRNFNFILIFIFFN